MTPVSLLAMMQVMRQVLSPTNDNILAASTMPESTSTNVTSSEKDA